MDHHHYVHTSDTSDKDGRYVVVRSTRDGYYIESTNSDHYDQLAKSRDKMLYRTLKIPFISDQIRALLPEKQEQLFQLLLEAEPALDAIFPKGKRLSLLWIAVLCCYQRSAELLVRLGADVNERCEIYLCCSNLQQWTILRRLIAMYPSSWNARFMALVIDHGADLEAPDSTDSTVLHDAVTNNRLAAARLFLERGADVNAADEKGNTPLMKAVSCRDADEQMLRLLLEYGADFTIRDKKGLNLLHRLVWAPVERPRLGKVLIERGVSLHQRVEALDQYQPLHLAVREGKIELVKIYLDYGADVNARAKNGAFPLYLAVEHNQPEVLQILVEYRANVDLVTRDGHTALHRACSREDLAEEYIRILMFAGANMSVKDHDGKTPFFAMDLSSPNIRVMLRMMAVRKVCFKPPFLSDDELRIKSTPELWKYYQHSLKQFGMIKRFKKPSNSCTFCDILMKCRCQTEPHVREPEFRKQLEEAFKVTDAASAKTMTQWSMYVEDIRAGFERAKTRGVYIQKQEKLIDEAVYGLFPEKVLHKMAYYAVGCKKCETNKIVHRRPESQRSSRSGR